MGEQAVETEIDPEYAEDIHSGGGKGHARPAEEPREQGEGSEQMADYEPDEGIGLQLRLRCCQGLGAMRQGSHARLR